jgi:hypothetical protein
MRRRRQALIEAAEQVLPHMNQHASLLAATCTELNRLREGADRFAECFMKDFMRVLMFTIGCAMLAGLLVSFAIPSTAAPWWVLWPAKVGGFVSLVCGAYLMGQFDRLTTVFRLAR